MTAKHGPNVVWKTLIDRITGETFTLVEYKGDRRKNKIRLRRRVKQYLGAYVQKKLSEFEANLTRSQRNFRLTRRQFMKRMYWQKIRKFKTKYCSLLWQGFHDPFEFPTLSFMDRFDSPKFRDAIDLFGIRCFMLLLPMPSPSVRCLRTMIENDGYAEGVERNTVQSWFIHRARKGGTTLSQKPWIGIGKKEEPSNCK